MNKKSGASEDAADKLVKGILLKTQSDRPVMALWRGTDAACYAARAA